VPALLGQRLGMHTRNTSVEHRSSAVPLLPLLLPCGGAHMEQAAAAQTYVTAHHYSVNTTSKRRSSVTPGQGIYPSDCTESNRASVAGSVELV